MISVERGLEIVTSVAAEHARDDWMPAESIPLPHTIGRVLREPIVSDADSPPFDKAIRDGFAVLASDVRQIPATLKIVGESRAGAGANVTIAAGQCCEIMTGAPLPSGANAVIMIEHTERVSEDTVRILKAARENEGLLRRAAEAREGERLFEPGKRIAIADISLLASVGKAYVLVSQKPRVAIIATGDELVEISETPGVSQIRNSNSYTLFAQSAAAGAHPTVLGIARDNLDDLRNKIRAGLDYDILLVTGGVSMGKYDLVEKVFAELGIQVFFEKVAMKPGKPTVFGYRNNVFVFGLPGNPISTLVAFQMFVRPIILSLLKAADMKPVILEATVEAPAKCDKDREALVPALVRFEQGTYRIATVPWKGSSDLAGLSRANALIMIPKRDGVLQPGETARFLPME